MRVLLKLIVDCEPDVAWAAIRSPEAFRSVAAPLLRFRSLEPDGFPVSWPAGAHPVAASLFGLVDVGEQVIAVSYAEHSDGVRIMTDDGGPSSGALTVVTGWRHDMAVAPAPGGGTLYRDRLIVRAGALTPLVWFGFWAFWQWRGIRLRAILQGKGLAGNSRAAAGG